MSLPNDMGGNTDETPIQCSSWDQLRICLEILGTLQHTPMSFSDLSACIRSKPQTVTRYLQFLVKVGFLISIQKDGKNAYNITTSGAIFFENVVELMR